MPQSTTIEFQELAHELFDDFYDFKNAIWVSLSNSPETNSDEPWNVEQATRTEHPVRIAFLQDALEDRQLLKYAKGRVTNSGQVNGLMESVNFTPKLKDIILWQGKEIVVRAVDPIQIIDEAIVYILEFGT